MDIRSVKDISHWIEQEGVATDREADSLARWVYEDILDLNSGEPLQKEHTEKIQETLQRLKRGEPIQYIAGHAWFFGYKLIVSPDVLIPRPETEELTAWLIEEIKRSDGHPYRVLDIGTGSGCIALTLKKKLVDRVDVEGLDISEKALDIARKNSIALDADVQFAKMDFLHMAAEMKLFDFIISNPPYVDRADIPEAMQLALRFEPEGALYPEGDDVDVFYRAIAHRGRGLLKDKGAVFLELNEFRAAEIEKLFRQAGWAEVEIRMDMQGAARMLRAVNR